MQFHDHQQPHVSLGEPLEKLTADTKLLQVYGTRVKLSWTCIYNAEDRSYTRYIIMPQNKPSTRRVLAEPFWESMSPPVDITGFVFGFMLARPAHVGPMVLLLIKNGAHYERVGCLPFHGRMASKACRTIVQEQDETHYKKVCLSPKCLEELWKSVGVTETVILA